MQTLPVLLYHSVDDDPPAWIAPFTVGRRAFVRQLDEIARSGRVVVPLERAVAAMSGGAPLPEQAMVLTFDDGFCDFYDVVFPELEARSLPATLYVTTGALTGGVGSLLPPARMLTWQHVAALAEAGVEIGAHTCSHPQLDVVPTHVAAAEITGSKHALEDALGRSVNAFAYPHGYSTVAVRRLVRDAGFSSAAAVLNTLSSPADDSYKIARLTLRADTSEARFSSWLSGTGAGVAPCRERVATKAHRWYRRGRSELQARQWGSPGRPGSR